MLPPRFVVLALAACAALAPAQQRSDAFVAGYVTAVIERELQLVGVGVQAAEGEVVLTFDGGASDRERLRQTVAALPGVRRVRFAGEAAPAPGPPQATASAEAGALQASLLFDALLADPRWPHFAASYHSYHGNDGLADVASVSFGESFSLWRTPLGERAQCELGVQAGVFAIFDLGAESKDLVNADYFVGPVLGFRTGDVSLLARLYHQSSHLGDEYLLRTRIDRVNLSYEVGDLLLSCDVAEWLRLYGGGGYLFDSEPELEPWLLQGGVELYGPRFDGVRALAAVDLQSREHHDWQRDVSVRAGVELEGVQARGLKLQLLLEYYRGRSPNGQFLEQDIDYYGVGFHLGF